MFIVLLTSIVNDSNHAKCVSLRNQKWEIQPTKFEYSQELHCYPFTVKLDINVLEVEILLLTYIRKYVIQIKQI